MSPSAPMPYAGWVLTNGLKSWVIEVSGELSITRVFPVVVAPAELDVEPELELELEHAASPAASRPAVATAKSPLWLCNLLISLVFLSGFIGYWAKWFSFPHLPVLRRRAPVRRGPGASKLPPASRKLASGPGPPGGTGRRRTGI